MARKNRLVVMDGLYHVTARVAHQERLLRDPAFKKLIVDWIYDIADFSGVDVCAWNIMDNHLHIFVHVPPVPEKYWLDKPERNPDGSVLREGTVPQSPAFSMRPHENRNPRWTPDLDDPVCVITPAGDSPSREAIQTALAEGLPVAHVPQAPTGFTMSDEEMLERLGHLYKPETVEKIADRWSAARENGRDDVVESEKDAFCRRMYNISQYMKTLKQRITQVYNETYRHEGQLWDGRFFSTLVDRDDALARLLVTSYIELNSYRTKKKIPPKAWRWCSYAAATGSSFGGDPSRGRQADAAVGSPLARKAREGYEKMFGEPWEEVVRRLESVFAAELPAEYDAEANNTGCIRTMAQLVKVSCRQFERGGFVSRDKDFAERTLAELPAKFPTVGTQSIKFFGRFGWEFAA